MLQQKEPINHRITLDHWLNVLHKSTSSMTSKRSHNKEENITIQSVLASDKSGELLKIAKDNNHGLFAIFLSCWGYLVGKYTRQSVLCIASPSLSSQPTNETNGPAFYAVDLGNIDVLLKDHIKEASDQVKQAMTYADYSYRDLIKIPSIRELNLHNGMPYGISYDSVHGLEQQFFTTDVNLNISKLKDGAFSFSLNYLPTTCPEELANTLLDHFIRLLSSLRSRINLSLQSIDLVSADEHKLITSWTGDDHMTCDHDNINTAFESICNSNPNKPALYYAGQNWTYQEINSLTDYFAAQIQAQDNWSTGSMVGILLDRKDWILLSILSIVKAGGVYVPIDPNLPQERQQYLIVDSQISTLITLSEYLLSIEGFSGSIIAYDLQIDTFTASDATEVHQPDLSPTSPAYLLYTSGSTGTPKGALIPHQAILRLVKHSNFIQLGGKSTILQTGSLYFDAATLEIWGAWLNAGCLIAVESSELIDPSLLKQLIVDHHVSHLWLTSSWFNQLMELDPSLLKGLTHLLAGGEKLSPFHINKFKEAHPDIRITNGYGPTENTTFTCTYDIEDTHDSDIPIGRPISGTTIYILDDHLRPVPPGAIGELYTAGKGLALEYWNRPALTSEKFIENANQNLPKMYRTGDLVYWKNDGNVAYVGREDDQIKLRGYRIELGEIEKSIESHPEINRAAVKLCGPNQAQELVGYYLSDADIAPDYLQDWLSKKMPAYMIPARWVLLDVFPLTSNGKTDYKELPDPQKTNQTEYVSPNTAIEKCIQEIWQETLDRLPIGIHDNFFSLGGDSIKAIRVVGKIQQAIGKPLQVKDLFEHQDIESLASFLENLSISATDSYESVRVELQKLKKKILEDDQQSQMLPDNWLDFYPMSEIQKGMFYFTLRYPKSTIYHDQIFNQIIDPDFDTDRMALAHELLVKKHDILRSSFHISKFECPLQVVHAYENIVPQYTFADLRSLPAADQNNHIFQLLETDKKNPFNPQIPGLWRTMVFRISDQEVSIFRIFHHAILDGWSNATFVTDLIQTYFQLAKNPSFQPPSLALSFKDYVIDQHWVNNSSEIHTFWKEYLKDWQRTPLPLQRTIDGEKLPYNKKVALHLKVPQPVCEMLDDLTDQSGIGRKEVGLAALMAMIQLTTGQSDITIGLVTNGRPDLPDADKMLGCFLNTVPFRMNINGVTDYNSLMEQVTALTRQMKGYDKLPLTKITQVVDLPFEGNNPFFDILYSHLNFHVYDEIPSEGIHEGSFFGGYALSNTLFDLILIDHAGELYLYIAASGDQYDDDELNRIGELYISVMTSQLADRSSPLPNKEILHLEERELINATRSLLKGTRKIKEEEQHPSKSVYQVPATTEQKLIVRIFEDVLEKSGFGIEANFFALGGDSIKAIRVAGKIQQATNKPLQVSDIFEYEDIKSLSSFVESLSTSAMESQDAVLTELQAIQKKILSDDQQSPRLPDQWLDFYPMSDIQEGMFYFTLRYPESAIYHDQAFNQIIDPDFDPDRMALAHELLVKKHEILRSSFHLADFECPLQVVHAYENIDPQYSYMDLRSLTAVDQQSHILELLEKDKKNPFNPQIPGLWRTMIFRISDQNVCILRVFHHAIFDGWSNATFTTDLIQTYYQLAKNQSYLPAPLALTFKDYVLEQRRIKKSTEIRTYWKDYLAGWQRTPLPLQKAIISKEDQCLDKVAISLRVPEEVCKMLNDLMDQSSIGRKEVGLAALLALIQVTTGQADITIGLVTNGRPDLPEADKMLGCFLNTVPFRMDLGGIPNFKTLIEQVTTLTRNMKGFDKLPLTIIEEEMHLPYQDENPFFDILYSHLNFHIFNEIPAEQLHDSFHLKGYAVSNTLFDLILMDHADELFISIAASSDHYDENELNRIGELFISVMTTQLSDGSAALPTMELLHPEEREQINATRVMLKETNNSTPVQQGHIIASKSNHAESTTPVQTELIQIWKEVLHQSEICLEANFFELGGHSLTLIRMIEKVRKRFKVDVPYYQFLQQPTLKTLSEIIQTPTSGIGNVRMIDLGLEAQLDKNIQPTKSKINSPRNQSILLTGATGFVGAYLLKSLIQQTEEKIYCLIRATDAEAAYDRIQHNFDSYQLGTIDRNRIIPVTGDLTKDRLGLNDPQWDELSKEIGTIYHNGAFVHFISNYDESKQANVNGTQEILRLACHHITKTVHFISTLSVLNNPEVELNENTPIDRQYHAHASGYTGSKWVAEKMVLEARKRGLPCGIYRLGRITGDSQHGSANHQDFFHRFLRGCMMIGSYPKNMRNIRFDLSPVDITAHAIVALASSTNGLGENWHIINDKTLTLDQLMNSFSQAVGRHVEAESYANWISKVNDHVNKDPDSPFAPILALFGQTDNADTPVVPDIVAEQSNTQLAELGIHWPDDSIIKVYATSISSTLETKIQA